MQEIQPSLDLAITLVTDLLGLAKIVELQPGIGYTIAYALLFYLIFKGLSSLVKVLSEWRSKSALLEWEKEKKLQEYLGMKYIKRKYPEYTGEIE